MTSIYVGGTFDLFHRGHVNLLRTAKGMAETVIVAVNSDAFAASYKGPTVCTLGERIECVAACRYVDMVIVADSHAQQRTYLTALRPTYLLHGDDWKGDGLLAQLNVDEEFLAGIGCTMRYVPYTAGVSSGDIKNRIVVREIAEIHGHLP